MEHALHVATFVEHAVNALCHLSINRIVTPDNENVPPEPNSIWRFEITEARTGIHYGTVIHRLDDGGNVLAAKALVQADTDDYSLAIVDE